MKPPDGNEQGDVLATVEAEPPEPEPPEPEFEARARESVDFLEKWGNDVFAQQFDSLNESDRKAFKKRLSNFRESFEEFAAFVEQMRPAHPGWAAVAFRHMRELMWASALLGGAGGVSKQAKDFHFAPFRAGGAEGGRNAAKTRRADADERHTEARQMIAKKLARNSRSRRKQSNRGLALEIQPRLETSLSLSTLERLIRDMKKG